MCKLAYSPNTIQLTLSNIIVVNVKDLPKLLMSLKKMDDIVPLMTVKQKREMKHKQARNRDANRSDEQKKVYMEERSMYYKVRLTNEIDEQRKKT